MPRAGAPPVPREPSEARNGTAIDAHVHFWDPACLRYPWLDEVPLLRRRFTTRDYPWRAGEAVIAVEANADVRESLAEVRFLDALAGEEPRIAGIVAFVDLTVETGLDATLARLVESTARVVGVRQNIQGRPASLCREPVFVRGVQQVGALGLPFDLCVTANQLPAAEGLVRRCPDTRFVLDHCGKPAIRHDEFASWADDVARLAAHPNVYCKLSGLLSEARPDQRTLDGIGPYLDQVLRHFGVERLLYASDWPVVTLAGGIDCWRAIVDDVTRGWPPAARRAIFADNASRVYDLRPRVHG